MMNSCALIDETVRRKVFWLLQRGTSLAVWSKKCDLWEKMAAAYESALQSWPGVRPERLNADILPSAFSALANFQKGVAYLRKGQRDVWRIGGSLYVANSDARLMQQYFYVDSGDFERGAFYGDYPPAVDALFQLLVASLDRLDNAPMEVPYARHLRATYTTAEDLLSPGSYQFPLFKYPYPVFPAVLPALPIASNTIIRSGDSVPHDGIWEPIEAEEKKKRFGLLHGGYEPGQGVGCFNYFVSGAKAPRFFGEFDPVTTHFSSVDVYWRLLWEDTRYVDGVIPDESEYLATVDPATVAMPPVQTEAQYIFSETGVSCPVSGNWAPLGFSGKPISIEAGARMPEWLVDQGAGEKKAHWVRWLLMRDQG